MNITNRLQILLFITFCLSCKDIAHVANSPHDDNEVIQVTLDCAKQISAYDIKGLTEENNFRKTAYGKNFYQSFRSLNQMIEYTVKEADYIVYGTIDLWDEEGSTWNVRLIPESGGAYEMKSKVSIN